VRGRSDAAAGGYPYHMLLRITKYRWSAAVIVMLVVTHTTCCYITKGCCYCCIVLKEYVVRSTRSASGWLLIPHTAAPYLVPVRMG